jgi:hypothetical protein
MNGSTAKPDNWRLEKGSHGPCSTTLFFQSSATGLILFCYTSVRISKKKKKKKKGESMKSLKNGKSGKSGKGWESKCEKSGKMLNVSMGPQRGASCSVWG